MTPRTIGGLVCAGALLAGIVAPAGAAEEWILAGDSAESDTRYLIDSQRFSYQVNQYGIHVIAAPLRVMAKGRVEDGYVAIDAASFENGGGEYVASFRPGSRPLRAWWTPHGARVYDAIGRTVCETAVLLAERAAKGPTLLPRKSDRARTTGTF